MKLSTLENARSLNMQSALSRALSTRRLTIVAGIAVAIGMGLRGVVSAEWILGGCDGRVYHLLAKSWISGNGFYLDDLHVQLACRAITPGPSNHYSPGMPIIEGLFLWALGDSNLAVVLPVFLLSWGAVLVVWWTTRDLYGEPAGLLVAGAVSIEWSGIYFATWMGYAENLVLIGVVLTLWAVLRALRDERFMILAGLFASVGYLAKASIGWFFLIAGLGGVIWRTWFRGWQVLRSRWYISAAILFAIPVALWSARNLATFWDGSLPGLLGAWQTSQVIATYVANAFADPFGLLLGLVGKLPILVIGLGLPFVPLLPSIRDRWRHWREEEPLGLLMTAGLVFALGWFFAAVTWLNEGSNLVWPDPLRYVAPAQVPLLWLIVREKPLPPARAWLVTYVILIVVLIVMSLLQNPNVPPRD
jgi:4-amino-4-deoxy-L-arabinose transferase-like glycosyltransferase